MWQQADHVAAGRPCAMLFVQGGREVPVPSSLEVSGRPCLGAKGVEKVRFHRVCQDE